MTKHHHSTNGYLYILAKNGSLKMIIWPNGTKEYHNSKGLHRLFGPAVVWKYAKPEYWIDGKRINRNQILSESKKYLGRSFYESKKFD